MTNRAGPNRLPSSFTNRVLLLVLGLSLCAFSIPVVEAATVPSPPRHVEVVAGPTQVAVTWDASSSMGSETLNYTARVWTLPPPTTSPVFASCATAGLGCVIGGLVTGTDYYVDVIAANGVGTSEPSAMKPISPGNSVSPPTNVSATSDSSGKVAVKWTPSTSLGRGKFAWYMAEVFTGPDVSAGAHTAYCIVAPATASTCFISGLKLHTTYYAQVRAVTSRGSSFPSSPRYKIFTGTATSSSPTPTSTASTFKLTKMKPKVTIYSGVVALYSGAQSPRSNLVAGGSSVAVRS